MTEELKQRALDLYKPPFHFERGYIRDADNQTVADQDDRRDQREFIAAQVRGWGRIQYLPDPEALQDKVGDMIAEALTEYWTAALALRGGIYKCNQHGGYGFQSDCAECQPGAIDKGEA